MDSPPSAAENRRNLILALISKASGWLSTDEILVLAHHDKVPGSDVTLRRDLALLVENGTLQIQGKAKATRYRLHPARRLTAPIAEEQYLAQEVDSRPGQKKFNFEIFDLLKEIELFPPKDTARLQSLKQEFLSQQAQLSDRILKKEFERLTIELSWKSSAIEGNTYSLLETETLLKEGIEATGKKAEEARMLLNHKDALEYIRSAVADFRVLSIQGIESLHSALVKDLGVAKGLRKRMVGITGTTYRPLDNEFQIREALEKTCVLINAQPNEFNRAYLALLLISYIQPFEDGNKRTSRLLANALLLAGGAFPLSFRSVGIQDYKKAIILFYELNSLPASRKIFLEQAEFAVKNYFRAERG